MNNISFTALVALFRLLQELVRLLDVRKVLFSSSYSTLSDPLTPPEDSDLASAYPTAISALSNLYGREGLMEGVDRLSIASRITRRSCCRSEMEKELVVVNAQIQFLADLTWTFIRCSVNGKLLLVTRAESIGVQEALNILLESCGIDTSICRGYADGDFWVYPSEVVTM